RTTISPLVDIRTRLVDLSDNELFSVQSNAPEYWRITALDKFDGKIWSSVGTYKPAGGGLPSGVRSRAATNTVTQKYAISGLSSIWLPAAFRPTHLDGIKKVRYDAESASLLTDAETSNGLSYRVESALPQLTPAELGSAPPVLPSSIIDRYLALPDGFPSSVARLANQVTQSASTPYAKAKALQDYLRNNFRYDLNVPAGHDDRALERFLFITKRGYCEQFAGSYAAMARAINLPSRVAVGGTPADKQPATTDPRQADSPPGTPPWRSARVHVGGPSALHAGSAAIGIGRRGRASNRRRAAAATAGGRAAVSWEEAEEALTHAG